MKGVKLAREQNPGTAHDDESKEKRVKEESSVLGSLDSGAGVIAGRGWFAVGISLVLPVHLVISP